MSSQKTISRPPLFALIDGAASPTAIQPLLIETGTDFRSVYTGLPEEALGPASLFLARIDDPDADWVTELDRIDQLSPCLSLVWGHVGIDDLATHFRAFLFTDIGDGVKAMIRFFDPRNTGAILRIWGDEIRSMFMAPIDRWMYRGRHADWQRIENDSLTGGRICKSITIELDQKDIDSLMEHTEPDELLESLIQQGVVNGERSYIDRFSDFRMRYQRALDWRLGEPVDRLNYCRHTYLYGASFDHHPQISKSLSERMTTGETYLAAAGRVLSRVWDGLRQEHESRSESKAGQEGETQ